MHLWTKQKWIDTNAQNLRELAGPTLTQTRSHQWTTVKKKLILQAAEDTEVCVCVDLAADCSSCRHAPSGYRSNRSVTWPSSRNSCDQYLTCSRQTSQLGESGRNLSKQALRAVYTTPFFLTISVHVQDNNGVFPPTPKAFSIPILVGTFLDMSRIIHTNYRRLQLTVFFPVRVDERHIGECRLCCSPLFHWVGANQPHPRSKQTFVYSPPWTSWCRITKNHSTSLWFDTDTAAVSTSATSPCCRLCFGFYFEHQTSVNIPRDPSRVNRA